MYNARQVSLQGIGIFKLRQGIHLPAEGEKDFSMPADAFSFEYNLKTTEDEALVDYIVKHTNKIKPLASSDLDSYAILAKQFLNLGKPFYIEGVGTIQKSQRGVYEFTPGIIIAPKIDGISRQLKEKKEESFSFESESTSNNSSRNLMIVLTFIGIGFVGLALYYFLVLKKPANNEIVEQVGTVQNTIINDTLKTIAPITDTISKNKVDSSNKIATAASDAIKKDSSSFKIVIKEYSSEKSVKSAYERLTNYGHKVVIVKIDSLRYKLVMLFTLPLSDTLRVKDSIREFFGGKPYVQF